jgi:HAE1 family hydrophobic/amphiphilic exporter-1/multidrug efflux pump
MVDCNAGRHPPGANALEVAKTVEMMATLSQRFPEGPPTDSYDTTRPSGFDRRGAQDAERVDAARVLVVYPFCKAGVPRSFPRSGPGVPDRTFAGIYLLGYSINTLTLFGMVLSIGIVVDDAIVVLEMSSTCARDA